jgi:glycosyltransferase involved in cell wall biosynthesis
MKLLVISQYYYPETFSITPICEGLVQRGVDVTVITGYPQYGLPPLSKALPPIQEDMIHGVRVIRLKTTSRSGSFIQRMRSYASFYRQSKRYLKKHQGVYDMVFAMSLSPLMGVSGAIDFAKKHRLPSALYCVDLWPESLVATNLMQPKGCLYRWINAWSQHLYKQFDEIWIGSAPFEAYLKNHHRLGNVRMPTIYQPVLPVLPSPSPMSFGVGFHLLYTGHLGKGHSLTRLLNSLEQMPSIHLHLVGHGEGVDALKQRGFNNVHVYDPVKSEQLGSYYQAADVCVVALDLPGPVGETIPHKLLQYFQAGKPVFGLLRGEGAHHMTLARGGWVISPHVSDELMLETLTKICQMTPSELHVLGMNNRLYFEKNFETSHTINEFYDRMQALIKSSRTSRHASRE